jgi:hypothetical protein
MSAEQYAALSGMLPARRGEWTLLHETARDGGVKHTKFHERRQRRGRALLLVALTLCRTTVTVPFAAHTVVVIRDVEGSIFGGYVDAAWHSRSAWELSAVAFLFCLKSSKTPAAAPFKMPLTGARNANAIWCDSDGGPKFGYGIGHRDMWVNSDGTAGCSIGASYKAGEPGSALSSSETVPVTRMEVWQLADS